MEHNIESHGSKADFVNYEIDFSNGNDDSRDDATRGQKCRRNNICEKSFDTLKLAFQILMEEMILMLTYSIERVFEFKEISKNHKVKFIVIKLKIASFDFRRYASI